MIAKGLGLWLAIVVAGLAGLQAYTLAPGEVAPPCARPDLSPAGEGANKPWTLIMAIHPRCPCTLASVSELERLMTRVGHRVQCIAYLYCPAGDSGFADTHLARSAAAVPGVRLVQDVDGRLARELGIHTSGGVVLFDSKGAPRFHGGLTAARGHEGDSVGKLTVMALVQGRDPVSQAAPTYGCRITALR